MSKISLVYQQSTWKLGDTKGQVDTRRAAVQIKEALFSTVSLDQSLLCRSSSVKTALLTGQKNRFCTAVSENVFQRALGSEPSSMKLTIGLQDTLKKIQQLPV